MALAAVTPRPVRGAARPRGVTLVELVVVLTLMGVVASLGATLVTRMVANQQDNRGRLVLAQAGDSARAQVSDALMAALPNSVRVADNSAGVWIEWVPVLDGGRYRQAPDTVSATPGDTLDLDNPADNSFDVIGTPLAAPPAGSQLVLHNLSTPDADAYAGTSRRSGLVVASGGRSLSFSAGTALPPGVGTARFFVVGSPRTLACVPASGGGFELRQYSNYGWLATQPTSTTALASATASLWMRGLAGCSASTSNALANIGLLNLRLVVGPAGGPQMAFMQQVPLDNTP